MKLKTVLVDLLLLVATSVYAQVVPGSGGVGGTITGQIQTATGGSITNGTLTFTLSQPAIVSNTATLATAPVSCYTSASGNIVGVPDPTVLPIVSVNLASGTLPAGNYFVKLYYTSANGTSVSSPEVQISLASQGTLIVNPPVNQPSSATGYGVGISATSGTELIQGTVTGWSQFQQSQPILNGGAAPTVNTSSCNIYFSDQLIPTGTSYSVNLVNRYGAKVAGFPQTWCTYGGAGGVINVSQGSPTGNCNTTGVFYPTPIFSNLQSGATQSVAGPLNFTGAVNFSNVTFGSVTFPGQVTFGGNNVYTGTQTVINGGIFTNAQMNDYLLSEVGGINNSTEYNTLQVGNFATEGISGGVAIPIGSSVHQANGVAGYASTAQSSSAGTSSNAVGVYGQCRTLANGSACWGVNQVVQDLPGQTNHLLFGDEVDFNLVGAPTRAHGILVTGLPSSGTMPAAPPVGNTNGSLSRADLLEFYFENGVSWPAGIVFSRTAVNGPGLQLDGTCAAGAVPCSSSSISMTGYDGSNVAHTATVQADSNGNVSSTPIIAGGAAAGLSGTGACATITTQSGGSWAGSAKCTGTTGASTLTITPGTTAAHGWVCDVQDETTRANLFQQTSHTTTTCVLTITSVTQNDVFVFTATAF